MLNEKKVYLRLRHRLQVQMGEKITLAEISQFIAHPTYEERLGKLSIHKITPEDKHLVVIDVIKVIEHIHLLDPELEVEIIGPVQTIVEIKGPRKTPVLLLVVFVWLLLFIGSGLAIMNFHEDVSMLQVHQKLYYIITGNQVEHPFLLQIPYSFGIGIGMIIFFNHVFKKRLNEEPSPLEVEMFLYQQNLDNYVVMNENKEVQRKIDTP